MNLVGFKVPEHKGTCCRDMSLQYVAATKSSCMHPKGCVAGLVAGT